MPPSRKRAFVFTWNNYTSQNVTFLQNVAVDYIVFGYETAPTTGTPHLQGYIYFHDAKTLSSVRKLLTGANVEFASGNSIDNYNYNIKGGEYYERGVRPLTPSEKGEKEVARWSAAYSAAKAGKFDEIPPNMMIQYYSTFKRIRREEGDKKIPCLITNLFPWQSELLNELLQPPNSRTVLWYYDPIGGSGKTQFANLMARDYKAHITCNGSTRDIAFGIPDDPRIIIFDYSRDVEERVNYAILEACKNGRIHSHKYESCVRYFDVPHVVVFANFRPDQSKLSQDRWDIRILSEEFIQ